MDRNAESPPAYGYEQTLSQRHHVFCFLRGDLPCAPQRGDCVVVQGISYAVDFVHADDDVVCLLGCSGGVLVSGRGGGCVDQRIMCVDSRCIDLGTGEKKLGSVYAGSVSIFAHGRRRCICGGEWCD